MNAKEIPSSTSTPKETVLTHTMDICQKQRKQPEAIYVD